MKVDWDRIITEDHKPSRASRRLVGGDAGDITITEDGQTIGIDEYLLPLSFLGGPVGFALGVGTYIASKIFKANAKEEAERAEKEARRQAWMISEEYYRENWTIYYEQYRKYKIPHMKDSYKYWGQKLKDEYGVLMEPESILLPAVDPIEEAAKELKEQHEYREVTQGNEAYAIQLRNEATRRDEAARTLARTNAIKIQDTAAMDAAKRSATNMRGAVNVMKQSALATMSQRSQNLKSLQELAKERSAVANAELQASHAIKANSAQLLAQQEAMRTKLRNEALAKQAAISAPKTVSFSLPKPKKVLAAQVKFGGSKASGYIQKLIEMDKLDPEAEIFDADLVQDPSRYIQDQLYEKSGRVREGIQKVKDIQKKQIVKSAVKKYVRNFKSLFNPPVDEVVKFATSWKRDGVEGAFYSAVLVTELGFLYLMKKYKNDALIVEYDSYLRLFKAGLSYEAGETTLKRGKFIEEDISSAIERGAEVIVIPFTLHNKGFEEKFKTGDKTGLEAHANMLIYRPKKNILERFEPHGEYTSVPMSWELSTTKMNHAIDTYFRNNLKSITAEDKRGRPFIFMPPSELYLRENWQEFADYDSTMTGFQLVENEYQDMNKLDFPGFCAMWSLYYLELVLKFPNMDGQELVRKAHTALMKEGGPKRFLEHMLGFIEYFEKELKNLIKATVKTELGHKVPTYSFKGLDESKMAIQDKEAINLYFELQDWYNQQIQSLMTKQREEKFLKTGAGVMNLGGSKASGYVQKLIAMYKDGLEVFDINKMKWASDNLKALGIMVEELDDSPAEFPMGRIGLKENREGKVEPKMEHSKLLIEPPVKKGVDAATLFVATYDGNNMRIRKLAHHFLRGWDLHDKWNSGNPLNYTGRVENGKYYRNKKSGAEANIELFTPEKFFESEPDRLKQMDDYLKSDYFKRTHTNLPAEFQVEALPIGPKKK